MTSTEHDITAVYNQAGRRLRQQIARHVQGDSALLDDVAQETWWRAIRTWPHAGVPINPTAWLSTVAQNILRNEHRSQRRRRIVPIDHIEAVGDEHAIAAPDQQMIAEENTRTLHAALEQLPAADREVIHAFYFDHLGVAAIATSKGLTDRAVEGRLRRARLKLRAILMQGRGVSDRFGVAGWLVAALAPIMAIFALATLLRLITRLSPTQLAMYRVVAGSLLIALPMFMAQHMARPDYRPWMMAFGALLAVWGGATHWRERARIQR
ncbi:MAG: polymerase sigma factor SigW [Gemmatimonadota bacterium]|jgi:RNA polymerase sigma-70 factor (ECF subfamily)